MQQPPLKMARKPKAGCEIANNEFRPHVAALDRLRVWIAPHALEINAAFCASLAEDTVNKTYAVLLGAFAKDTTRRAPTRRASCASINTATPLQYQSARMPVSHFLLAAFIAHRVGSVGGSTVKGWHDLNGAKWEGDDQWVELVRRTANKEGTPANATNAAPSPLNTYSCSAFWTCQNHGFGSAILDM
jgi:hypothetical protein